MNQENIDQIIKKLSEKYPSPKPSLDFSSPYEALVAVVLSAQCTDKRVNQVTKSLFPNFNSPEKIIKLGEEKLKEIIKPCGFFNAKAKNIMALSGILIEKYNSQVPNSLEELTLLPGVGRKTASVILNQIFNIPAFPVDTHIFQVTNRLGIVKAKNPLETELQIRKKVDEKYWADFHLQLIFHGRETCKALSPRCFDCILNKICTWNKKSLYLSPKIKIKHEK